MATFLRRQIQKLGRKDETPATLTIARPEGGNVTFSRAELQRYTMLHHMLDSDLDGEIGGLEGASFLRRCGLADNALREVWRLASGGTSKAKLTRDDFLVACKLVAVAQARGEPTMLPLLANEALPLADFHYDLTPDVTSLADSALSVLAASAADEFPRDSIRITVANPTTFGSAMDKHTKYLVSTMTSLPHFPRKEVSVWRRFSDFEWLHKRLSICFPAAVIPLFPVKRVVGNSDTAFIAERMSQLSVYMEKVAVHPALGTSLDFILLLDASDVGLEAAKSYIEAVASEASESLLEKGMDAMSNLVSSGGSAPPLVLKADEEFIAAVSMHNAALARLQALTRTGDRVDASAMSTATAMLSLGKAMVGLAEHERKNANVIETTTSAVAEAARAVSRSGAAFGGAASTAPPPAATAFAAPGGAAASSIPPVSAADAAAAAAFSAHAAAANAGRDGTIAGLFAGADFSDPYSALATVAATPTKGSSSGGTVPPVVRAESLPELLIAAGECLMTQSATWREQLKGYESTLLSALRTERDKEFELAEALRRREGTIERAQEAHSTLLRKKKALVALRPSDKDYAAKVAHAQHTVDKAETALTARKEELDKVSDIIKGELLRVVRGRRTELLARLSDFATEQAAAARARAEPLGGLTLTLSGVGGGEMMERSREAVTVIAKKAEAKARASAMTAAKSAGAAPVQQSPTAAAAAAGGGVGAAGGGVAAEPLTEGQATFAAPDLPSAEDL